MRPCTWCSRVIPVRPGSFNLPVSHVCVMFGRPTPYGLLAIETHLGQHAGLVDREEFLRQAGDL